MDNITLYTITHSSVNIDKSFIILDGIGHLATFNAYNTGIYISSRSSTSFVVSSTASDFQINGIYSYQIVEFN